MNQTLESLLRHCHIFASLMSDLFTLKSRNTFMNKTHTITLSCFLIFVKSGFEVVHLKVKNKKDFKIKIKLTHFMKKQLQLLFFKKANNSNLAIVAEQHCKKS